LISSRQRKKAKNLIIYVIQVLGDLILYCNNP
jgi:hypothetical protein